MITREQTKRDYSSRRHNNIIKWIEMGIYIYTIYVYPYIYYTTSIYIYIYSILDVGKKYIPMSSFIVMTYLM